VLSGRRMSIPGPIDDISRRLSQAWEQRAFHVKAASFAAVGLVNFAVDFGIFTFAYYVLGLPIIAANICSWLVAVTGSYIMNSLTTFAVESERRLRLRDYLRFGLSQTGGLVANTVTVYVLHWFLPVPIAKVLAVGVSFLVNFSLSHFIVFRRANGPGNL
jgi:putative flippase GtrA